MVEKKLKKSDDDKKDEKVQDKVVTKEAKVEETKQSTSKEDESSTEKDEAPLVVEPVKEEKQGYDKRDRQRRKPEFNVEEWQPVTSLGKMVKSKEITDISQILDNGLKILEAGIVDVLIPNIESELLLIGQSKGKFGGGKRRIFKQVQKKTAEGNKPKFLTMATVGNGNGYVGIGRGKSKETVPAREKALRNARLNVIKIRRGCGSWQCGCGEPHTIPFRVEGKCGSSIITLYPAPKGTGLKIEKECSHLMRLAGITDVWSKTRGQTKTKLNLLTACFDALKKLMSTKISPDVSKSIGIVEGQIASDDGSIDLESDIIVEVKDKK
jgi:small subunit ribosomal protein S5